MRWAPTIDRKMRLSFQRFYVTTTLHVWRFVLAYKTDEPTNSSGPAKTTRIHQDHSFATVQ